MDKDVPMAVPDKIKAKYTQASLSPFREDVHYRTAIDAHSRPTNVGCGFMLKPHAQGGYQHRTMPQLVAVFVLRGTGTYTDWQGQSHRVKAGSVILFPPDHEHSMTHDADGQWAEFFFTIPPQVYLAMQAMGDLSAERTAYNVGTQARVLDQLEIIHALMHQTAGRDLAQVWAQCHVMLAQMLELDRQQQKQLDHEHDDATTAARRQISRACQLLGKNLSKRLTPAQVADELGLGYEYFRKLFREEMGISPGEFRICRRLDLARKLIALEKLSNKEVAYQLGYADPFTFSKQFRKYTGQSPAAFRASV